MRYVIGVDCGATKTISAVADENGNLLGIGVGGPSNYFVAGKKMTRQAIAEAVNTAVQQSGLQPLSFKTMCLGAPGASNPKCRGVVEKIVRELNLAERIIVCSDLVIALMGALMGNPGVIVIAGTGSSTYGINKKGETARAGGWGYLLGDEGSAYYIGLKAITAALRAYDGRASSTTLIKGIVDKLNLNTIEEIVERVYSGHLKHHEIANLAPIVVEAARKGDKISIDILEEAGKELGLAAVAVIKALRMENEEFELATVGGVFNAGELIFNPFRKTVEKVAPRVKFTKPKFEPVLGAIILALKESGIVIDDKKLINLRRSFNVLTSQNRAMSRVQSPP